MVMGVVLTLLGLFVLSKAIGDNASSELTMLEEPSGYIETTEIEVFQVLKEGSLARTKEKESDGVFVGPIVLLLDETGSHYDNEIIKIERGKKLQQVGVYKYASHINPVNTVPAVRITE